MTNTDNTKSLTKMEADSIARRGGEGTVFHVRAGTRHIGWYTDEDIASQMADFYNARVFDWTTGEYA